MKLFAYGKEVKYNNHYYTVSHVTVIGHELLVHLNGIGSPVNEKYIECELTTFTLKRVEYSG
jgi:hypothetical protein